MSTAFKEATKRSLGDRAQAMLDAGAVVPVKIGKGGRKVPVTKWKNGVDPDKDWKFTALAFMTGLPSGITVIDYDSAVPDACNVVTRRGGHSYVPFAHGDRNRQHRDLMIDVRGAGGLAIFHSKHHEVIDLNLRDRADYLELIHPVLREIPESKYVPSGLAPRAEGLCSPEAYQGKVDGAGYTIDVEWSTKQLTGQVRNSKEGYRNATFYKNLSQVIMIGGDTEAVIRAALDAGLPMGDVARTVASVDNDPQGIDIYDHAYDWMDSLHTVMKSRVASEIVSHAIEQTSMNPFISQVAMAEALGIDKATVYRQMKRLSDARWLDVTPNGTIPGTTKTAPNNYRLIVPTA